MRTRPAGGSRRIGHQQRLRARSGVRTPRIRHRPRPPTRKVTVRVITRESQHCLHLCPLDPGRLRVTPSHRAAGHLPTPAACTGPLCAVEAAPGERTDRASPFLAHTHHCGHRRGSHAVCLRFPRRRQRRWGRWRRNDRRYRPRRPADRRPLGPGHRHPELRRARREDCQQERGGQGRHVRARAPRRRGTGPAGPAERHQARRRRGRHGRRRPAELRRRPVHAEGLRRRRPCPGLARQHQPRPDPGRGVAGRREGAAVRHVLPRVHHRRHPGPVRGAVPLQRGEAEEGLRHRRQEDLRRRLPRRRPSPTSSRSSAARSSGPTTSTPTTRTSRPSPRRSRTPAPISSTTAASTRPVPRWPPRSRRPGPRSRPSAATRCSAPSTSPSPRRTPRATWPAPSAPR